MADDIREELRDIIRGRNIGPFGPNSLAILVNGGVSHLTPREAEDIADAILASPVIARIRAEAIVSLADQLVDESIAVNNNAIGKPQAEWLLRQAERLSIAAEVIRAHASIRSGSEED